MPTPTKPVAVLEQEGRSHRTKKELEARRKAEDGLKSGSKISELPEVRSNPAAHRVFRAVKKMLKQIDRDDKLHEAIVNRYCIITAECEDIVHDRALIEQRCLHLESALEHNEMEIEAYIRAHQKAVDQKNAIDRALQTKRKMLLDIEKECLMTIAAALRAIPKDPPEEKSMKNDPMALMLARRSV